MKKTKTETVTMTIKMKMKMMNLTVRTKIVHLTQLARETLVWIPLRETKATNYRNWRRQAVLILVDSVKKVFELRL